MVSRHLPSALAVAVCPDTMSDGVLGKTQVLLMFTVRPLSSFHVPLWLLTVTLETKSSAQSPYSMTAGIAASQAPDRNTLLFLQNTVG